MKDGKTPKKKLKNLKRNFLFGEIFFAELHHAAGRRWGGMLFFREKRATMSAVDGERCAARELHGRPEKKMKSP